MGLWGLVCNRNYIRWKVLLCLGTAFWLLLCLYDVYLADPVTKFYHSDYNEFGWLAQVAEEEIVPENLPHGGADDIHFPEENIGFGANLILWNALAFLITFIICAVGRIAYTCWLQLQDYKKISNPESTESLNKRFNSSSSSKIPILLPSKSVTTSTQDNSSETSEKETQIDRNPSFTKIDKDSHPDHFLRGSSTSIEINLTPNKDQHMEKQCAKLRDEMIYIQASSLKEHAALSRKLELVTKEKRDLTRQLMIAQKENRTAKAQLEELLAEKTLLIKRLECATKEFKTNTKSKKHLLAKLEESQVTISSLKQEVDRVTKEKEHLRSKIQVLDVEYRLMKDRLRKYEQSPEKFNYIKSPIKDNDSKNAVDQIKVSEIVDINQSQKDVQRVQLRLMNLEKSLDKLQLCKLPKYKENRSESNTDLQMAKTDQEHGSQSIQTDSETDFNNSGYYSIDSQDAPLDPQQEKLNILRECDNLTDEQRRKILTPEDFSGDEYIEQAKYFANLNFKGDFGNEHSFEMDGNILNYLNSPSTPLEEIFYASSQELMPVSENITNNTSCHEDESSGMSGDESEPPKNRFVSNSAAFKKFLKSMTNLDKTQSKIYSVI